LKCFRFLVNKGISLFIAIAAIKVSFNPMGVPFFFKMFNNNAAFSEVSFVKGKIEIEFRNSFVFITL